MPLHPEATAPDRAWQVCTCRATPTGFPIFFQYSLSISCKQDWFRHRSILYRSSNPLQSKVGKSHGEKQIPGPTSPGVCPHSLHQNFFSGWSLLRRGLSLWHYYYLKCYALESLYRPCKRTYTRPNEAYGPSPTGLFTIDHERWKGDIIGCRLCC